MVSFRESPAALPPTMSWRDYCALPEVAAPALAGLSPAERVVAMQVAQGLSNREIAATLGKSEFTVKHQVSAILKKLGVPTRGRLIALLR
ncbi:MAG TPA: LuxR C-terminal-related transcriptional regulator [Opitutaceae bacterium]|nr:LuxR C-terminal-related transcriptional regulator [Opitutaceae bacterium]